MTTTYTTSKAFLEALSAAGVRHIFANLGSDHPGILEEYAIARTEGRLDELPQLVLCPHESVALSAAQGHAQVSGVPQAVLVHVECGTQNMGGMLHNVAKGRAPVLIFAGASPFTQEGELLGSRTEHIHWLQDVHDQRGIVRGYTKYDNEIRTGRNIKQLVFRALQIARSEPAGPVYLMGAREVMESETEPRDTDPADYSPIAPAALAPTTVRQIAEALAQARRPLVVTSHAGRDAEAVAALVELCELLAVPVVESAPTRMNFPADHPLHWGFQWNQQRANPLLGAADVVLVVASDVPWIPTQNRPNADARLFVVDSDPVKEQMPLWHVPAECFARADPARALRQISAHLRERRLADPAAVAERLAAATEEHDRQRAAVAEREAPDGDVITPEYLVGCVREAIGPDDLVLTEAITSYHVVSEHLRRNRPGTLIGSGGGSLGWWAGAAIGAKLAAPDRTVVSIIGDGTYLFGVPSSAFWVARRYNAPSLTIILDNQGWKAPRMSALAVRPHGVAAANEDFNNSFQPGSDLAGIAAAAGDAFASTVCDATSLPKALREALDAVKAGRPAVLSVRVPVVTPPPGPAV